MEKERVQKVVAQAGYASRRKVEELIVAGKVKINGKIATLGDKADRNDQIEIDGMMIGQKEENVYYVLNKPERTICTLNDPQDRPTVMSLIDEKSRIYPVGRLDYDTTGVLLLTNDGELAFRLTHPSFEVLRVYRARLSRPLTEEEEAFLNSDRVVINNKPSKQKVEKVDNKSYMVVLHVGTYHHVKKLFEIVDNKVIELKRVEYAGITCEKMPIGTYRRLNVKEVRWLKQLTKMI